MTVQWSVNDVKQTQYTNVLLQYQQKQRKIIYGYMKMNGKGVNITIQSLSKTNTIFSK